jgi:Zinc finger C-x8-C-x5-C-x3-H type (and similar)
MATTTLHYHYPITSAGHEYQTAFAQSSRRLSEDTVPKESWELTTRASSFESLDSSEHQQTSKVSVYCKRESKPSSRTIYKQKQTQGKSNLSHCNASSFKHAPVNSTQHGCYKQNPHKSNAYYSGQKKPQTSHAQYQSEDEVKYKTEMCKNLRETGSCKFGSKCKFAHSEDEIRNKTHINLHYRSKKCSQFFEHGYCPYGTRCQYLHTEDSYTEIFNSYCEKLLVWTARNPQLDMTAIMRKTHPFVTGLEVFKTLYEKED